MNILLRAILAVSLGIFLQSRCYASQIRTEIPSAQSLEKLHRVLEAAASDSVLDIKAFGTLNKRDRRMVSQGSGAVISGILHPRRAYILTNYHVVNTAPEKIYGIFHNPRLNPIELRIVGFDERLDLALLAPIHPVPLAPLAFGDSDLLQNGDQVIPAGYPNRFDLNIGSGIVTSDGPRETNLLGSDSACPSGVPSFIISNASTGPGGSGGPLFNSDGDIVGVNECIGLVYTYSIPSNVVKAILPRLEAGGKVTHGILGIWFQDSRKVTPLEYRDQDIPLPLVSGPIVMDVADNTPAAKSGIEIGDIVLAWNGIPTPDLNMLMRFMRLKAFPGDLVRLTVSRRGEELKIPVRFAAGDPLLDDVYLNDISKRKKIRNAALKQ